MTLSVVGAAAVLLVAVPVVSHSGAPSSTSTAASAARPTASPTDDPPRDDDAKGRGQAHAAAVKAWVACKHVRSKTACTKPAPPGRALSAAHHADKAPGPASTHGKGHAWGHAHAPGQLRMHKHAGDDQDG